MTDMSFRRLRREFRELQKNPLDNIVAAPLDTNILEWHYVITGTKGTPYEGGYYHGIVRFPPEYPLKPPSIIMYTPSGRFATGRRICLSNSDFHPESWNPVWGVSTILMGLYSFMLDSATTLGSVSSTPAAKKRYAEESLSFNMKDKTFCSLFPDLVDLHKQREDMKMKQHAVEFPDSSADVKENISAPETERRQEEPGILLITVCLALIIGMLAILLQSE